MARYSTNDNATIFNRVTKTDIFSTPGSTTWTVPASVTCATFELWGSGGGGGAKCCCDCYHQGQGGTGGSYVAMTMPVVPGDVYTLCIPPGAQVCNIGGEGSHFCCFGGSGATAFVTGNGITTLCAGGGVGGNNDCYLYCLCECMPVLARNNCSVSSYTGSVVSCAAKTYNYCNEIGGGTVAGGCRISTGWVGCWSDSQSMYYPTSSGGTAWTGSQIRSQEWCCGNFLACMNCSMNGTGGAGAHMYSCDCMPGGTGRNGLIMIRY